MTRPFRLRKIVANSTQILFLAALILSAPVATGQQKEISQRNFIYTPSEMLSFDIEAYLNREAPHLVYYSEVISHWSGRSSISPRILISLLEHQSNTISQPSTSQNHDSALSKLPDEISIAAKIEDSSIALAKLYYQNKENKVPNPASTALQSFLMSRSTISDTQTKLGNESAIKKSFSDTFFRLFPEEDGEKPEQNINGLDANPLPPANLLQLPYPIGESWQTWGGTHSFPGTNSGPRSSLDFRRDRQPFGSDTSNKWVSSASSGQAVRHSSCFVEIIGPNGWSTSYYHLDNVAVNTGQGISRNQRLANYADNLQQSLCGGGKSNGPHVHFSLKLNGNYHALNGVKLSGYVVHTGRTDYDSNCSFFWLDNNGSKVCAGVPALNNGVINPITDLSLGSFSAALESTKSEQSVRASATVSNLGNVISPETQVNFLVSNDPGISFNDTTLIANNIVRLEPSQSISSSATVTTTLEPGEYWLGACVVGVQGESNTGNNCSTGFPIILLEEQKIVLAPLQLLLEGDDQE